MLTQYRDVWIATVAVFATATLDYVSQIGLFLCVSHHPRWPRQVQPQSLSEQFSFGFVLNIVNVNAS